MTKEKYIELRQNNDLGEIIYQYYQEGFNSEKHKNFFEKQDFLATLNFWGQINNFIPGIISYYNVTLDVIELKDKNGVIIKYL